MSGAASGVRQLTFSVLRALFRALPMPASLRDRLRNRGLDRIGSWSPPPPRGRIGAAADGIRPLQRADERAIGYAAAEEASLPAALPATLVAFYLPQFHPFEENDAWWGKGFTEWRNVSRALPQFEGHVQPRLPGDLGFYDLRVGETLRAQARLATDHGIGAFCFYFYWFSGHTLMEQPLRQWLADSTIELPFCLCWANENWTRRWDGRNQDVLIGQQHSAEDDLAFIAHVADYLRDRRALKVEGRPVLLLYRPQLLPDPKATAARWRGWCRDNGIGEIHLAYVQSFERPDPRDIGFDAAVEFPPNIAAPRQLNTTQFLLNPDYEGDVRDWRELAAQMRRAPLADYPLYPGVNPGWDNEARRPGRGRVLLHASPRGYSDWLHDTVHERLRDVPQAQRLVFINAWNEWAESAVLEPDARLGHAWLQATSEAMITVLRLSAPTKDATRVATMPASSAASASAASRVAGRRSVTMPSRPIIRPMTPAVAMSSHGSFHMPATPAAPRVNERMVRSLPRRPGSLSNWRSAVWPWAMLIRPLATSSAIWSATLSLCRSFSPGARRITRVMSLEPIACAGSLKLRMIPVGFDHGSQSRSSWRASATTAVSRRWAVVP